MWVTRSYHRVKGVVRGLLESRGFTCFDEVYAVVTEGASPYADTVAFDSKSDLAYVLDPTVHFESNDESQAETIAKDTFCIQYNFALRRLYQNFKSIRLKVLPILCPPYLKNGFRQFKNLLYSILMLFNLDLISFWATSDKQECHFT
ncbi:hypothetical protein O3M35_000409 [Rhynocoris fuscipes]|uniref:Uncharacterized protein n=1 Tax=Rhynocoris fuscipes TaxID=488301 RepID=A0AAW1DLF4_9HEMI